MDGLLTQNNKILQQWYQLFKSYGVRSFQSKQHWKQLINLGLPTSKHEQWKYTSLENLMLQQFTHPIKNQKVSAKQVAAHALPIDAICLVFIDGVFNSELSNYKNELFIIQHHFINDDTLLPSPIQPEIFLHLTESLATEVTFIRLPSKKNVSRPLYLLHLASGRIGTLNTVHHRHHFELEEGSKAKVIEHYVTLNGMPHFTGSRFTFNVADNACLTHIKLTCEQNYSYHFAHNDIVIGYNANVSSNNFLLGNNLLRHNTSVQLNGENTKLSLNSLVLPKNSEISDTRSYLEHNKGYCLSRQLHKTIARDKSCAVFNGHIKVAQHAFKTDSKMINNNLLLGRLAEVNTKPQLEIYADDVKCSHGATVGCIDDEQIFYLRSRGISKNIAINMIIHAFADELIESLEDKILRQVVLRCINNCFNGV
ncbi:Fe-S cluster assembly protein SufD [Pantoea sp. Aalb]|uniref:Fe-S cluster assembly protein SufD n=1 Tax=Pantoea sp. Aalb TaxID=2576762 RepID=UPI001326468E|nr:Fe-S cluster assembly protein SufD [Pantoea sp. Aalb]MXP67426.1 Fe-S cluster assembly protein SufD [Pantoea sp. Aalb]